jgi:hypothetical protein
VLIGIVKTYGGAYQATSVRHDLDAPDLTKLKKAEEICHKQYLLRMLLQGADQSRYSKLKNNLLNDMTKGADNFPKTMVKTLQLMSNYKVPVRAKGVKENGEGVAFVQEGKVMNSKDIECRHCSKKGHYQSNCPKVKVEGADDGIKNFTIEEFDDGHGLFLADKEDECMFVQNKGAESILSPDHLYIDTCASYPSMPYAHLLDNLMKQLHGLRGHTNSGSTAMDMAGNLGAIKKMWLNKCGVVSIVPLKVLKMIWPILYHSKKGMNLGHFIIHTDKGGIVVKSNSHGMLFLNLKEVEAEVALCLIQDTIKTVQNNMEGFTKREVEEAKAAREAQEMLGDPTDRKFLGMVHSNIISNCSISETTVKYANLIFGPDLTGLRERTVRRLPNLCILNTCRS